MAPRSRMGARCPLVQLLAVLCILLASVTAETTLYVSGTVGIDGPGRGAVGAPLRTLSAALIALQNAGHGGRVSLISAKVELGDVPPSQLISSGRAALHAPFDLAGIAIDGAPSVVLVNNSGPTATWAAAGPPVPTTDDHLEEDEGEVEQVFVGGDRGSGLSEDLGSGPVNATALFGCANSTCSIANVVFECVNEDRHRGDVEGLSPRGSRGYWDVGGVTGKEKGQTEELTVQPGTPLGSILLAVANSGVARMLAPVNVTGCTGVSIAAICGGSLHVEADVAVTDAEIDITAFSSMDQLGGIAAVSSLSGSIVLSGAGAALRVNRIVGTGLANRPPTGADGGPSAGALRLAQGATFVAAHNTEIEIDANMCDGRYGCVAVVASSFEASDSTVRVTNNIQINQVHVGACGGGVSVSQSSMTLTRCTVAINGNAAWTASGAGMCVDKDGRVDIVNASNTHFSDNIVCGGCGQNSVCAGGGALYIRRGGTFSAASWKPGSVVHFENNIAGTNTAPNRKCLGAALPTAVAHEARRLSAGVVAVGLHGGHIGIIEQGALLSEGTVGLYLGSGASVVGASLAVIGGRVDLQGSGAVEVHKSSSFGHGHMFFDVSTVVSPIRFGGRISLTYGNAPMTSEQGILFGVAVQALTAPSRQSATLSVLLEGGLSISKMVGNGGLTVSSTTRTIEFVDSSDEGIAITENHGMVGVGVSVGHTAESFVWIETPQFVCNDNIARNLVGAQDDAYGSCISVHTGSVLIVVSPRIEIVGNAVLDSYSGIGSALMVSQLALLVMTKTKGLGPGADDDNQDDATAFRRLSQSSRCSPWSEILQLSNQDKIRWLATEEAPPVEHIADCLFGHKSRESTALGSISSFQEPLVNISYNYAKSQTGSPGQLFGGAIYVSRAGLFRLGDPTDWIHAPTGEIHISHNSAQSGGAAFVDQGAKFEMFAAEVAYFEGNVADIKMGPYANDPNVGSGGALYMKESNFETDTNMQVVFRGNAATRNGGALALIDMCLCSSEMMSWHLVRNSAGLLYDEFGGGGGAFFFSEPSCVDGCWDNGLMSWLMPAWIAEVDGNIAQWGHYIGTWIDWLHIEPGVITPGLPTKLRAFAYDWNTTTILTQSGGLMAQASIQHQSGKTTKSAVQATVWQGGVGEFPDFRVRGFPGDAVNITVFLGNDPDPSRAFAKTIRHSTIGGCPDKYGFDKRTMSCVRCPTGTYVLSTNTSSPFHGTNESIQSNLVVECRSCPWGGQCSDGGEVEALPSFWGQMSHVQAANGSELAVVFTICPPGYCCESSPCGSFDACREGSNRVGRLCGSCKAGYSPAITESTCIRDSDCSDGWWFWPACIAAAAVGTLFYLRYHRQSSEATGEWAVIGYYVQLVDLCIAAGSPASIGHTLSDTMSSFFNLQLAPTAGALAGNSPGGSSHRKSFTTICPLAGMSSTGVIAFELAGPGLLVLAACGAYVAHSAVVWCISRRHRSIVSRRASRMSSLATRRESDSRSMLSLVEISHETSASTGRRSVGTVEDNVHAPILEPTGKRSRPALYAMLISDVLLMSYTVIITTCLNLLNCTKVEGDNGMYLFLGADVECYQAWQVGPALVVVLGAVLPFALNGISNKLHRTGYHFTPDGLKAFSAGLGAELSRGILVALEGPYSKRWRSWKAAVTLRRLSMAGAASLMAPWPITRVIVLLCISLSALSAQLLAKPFRSRAVNALEASLLALVTVACVLSVPAATLQASQAVPAGDAAERLSKMLNGLSIVQAVLVAVPSFCMFVYGVSVVCRKGAQRLRSRSKSSAPNTLRERLLSNFDGEKSRDSIDTEEDALQIYEPSAPKDG